MLLDFPPLRLFRSLTPDGRLLFLTRFLRLFAYGFLSVELVFYLVSVGLNEKQIGALLALTLLGDMVISLWITTTADRVGRKRMLQVGAALMIFGGGVFALTGDFWLLLLAATLGVISPSGNEVGPFLSIEQAGLAQTIPAERRTEVFAWYNLTGSVGTALGALSGGAVTQALQKAGLEGTTGYRPLLIAYAGIGLILALLFAFLSPAAEIPARSDSSTAPPSRFGLHRSGQVVLFLSSLFALDAFGGGFVIQSIVAYWFHLRFGVEPATIGAVFFGANLLAGLSALSAAWVARHIGLLNTMVFTHLPSNVLLLMVPLMPNLPLAIVVLLFRFSISQMDVPTRQSYTIAVVSPDERSAAAGVAAVARSLGAALSPLLAVLLLANPKWISVPFFLAGGIKIVYDLILYGCFAALKPPEEKG
jgi:MFS family permease